MKRYLKVLDYIYGGLAQYINQSGAGFKLIYIVFILYLGIAIFTDAVKTDNPLTYAICVMAWINILLIWYYDKKYLERNKK